MTREKAINVLEDALSRAVFMDDIDVLEMAIAALREQEELESKLRVLESSGWISVEERLPEAKTPVLTLGRRNGIGIGYVTEHSCRGGMAYFYARYGDCLPTHWMPLPEPPKEEV